MQENNPKLQRMMSETAGTFKIDKFLFHPMQGKRIDGREVSDLSSMSYERKFQQQDPVSSQK